MTRDRRPCPDCDATTSSSSAASQNLGAQNLGDSGVDRRAFLRTAGAVGAAATLGSLPLWTPAAARAADQAAAGSSPESLVKVLYDALTPGQREKVCYAWDHMDPKRGLLRTRVANNWKVNEQDINSDFYNDDQRAIIRSIFERIIQPDWHKRIDQQLTDDAGGYGEDQALAIFGTPGSDKCEFVMTGRHMTIRCDGNAENHVAFGGPIFYGHAANGFNEGAAHEGNVFWPQALAANKVYQMMDEKQRAASRWSKSCPTKPPSASVVPREASRASP